MAFTKDRFVTACQQLLVTAAVSTLALTAASVVTLDIVGPDASRTGAASATLSADMADVAIAPVSPKVREVALSGPAGRRALAAGPARGLSRASAPRLHGLPVAVTSTPQPVGGYATVGVVWNHGVHVAESTILMQVRTLDAGVWSGWQRLQYHDDHGPGGTEEASPTDRPGSDPLAVGHVEKVQLRVATASGQVPAGMEFSLIDPGATKLQPEAPAIQPTGATVQRTTSSGTTSSGTKATGLRLSAMKVAPKPKIYSRAQWGANEKLREKGKPDYGTIKTGFVHHTVNKNNYTRDDVPAMIRGIYAYHVVSRGWRDIGYNFLVDRFGRIWEGRYGGVNKAVIGAHTLGYNDVAFAMSAIGNFDIAEPPKAVIDAFARLFAWKLSMYNIKANASGLKVHGKTLHAINGHRDVGQTACPGKYLYAKIPEIRRKAAKIQNGGQISTPVPTPTPTPTPPPTSGYNPARTPEPAQAQPTGMGFVRARNVVGSADPDLVLQAKSGDLSMLSLGRLTGFRSAKWSKGSWRNQSVVAVGDITGDGRGDVLTRRPGDRGWKLHRGLRGGKVAAAPDASWTRLRRATSLIPAGDWNRDGHTDVLALDADHELLLFKGRGKGRFAAPVVLATAWPYVRRTVVAGDLDRDGHPDLVGMNSDGVMFRIDSLTPTVLAEPVRGRAMTAYNRIIGGGDMSGDGIGDLWVRDRRTGDVTIMLGDGTGRFRGALGPFGGFGSWQSVNGVDMGGTSRPDVVGVNAHGRLVVRRNNGRLNVRSIVRSGLRAAGSTQVLSVGDWDRDGRPDVITREDSGNVLVLHRGLGGGRFGGAITMASGWRTITGLTAVGDITGDHLPDLVGRNASGVMVVFRGNGKHGFHRVRRLPASLRTFNTVGGTRWRPGLFPGSAVTTGTGSFVPFGGGTVATAFRNATGTALADYDAVIGVGDVDGDGRPDVLARDRAHGTLWLVRGKASGFGHRLFIARGLGKYRIGG